MTPDQEELALIRLALFLGLGLAALSLAFRAGLNLGWRAAVDDLQWHVDRSRQTREQERAETR